MSRTLIHWLLLLPACAIVALIVALIETLLLAPVTHITHWLSVISKCIVNFLVCYSLTMFLTIYSYLCFKYKKHQLPIFYIWLSFLITASFFITSDIIATITSHLSFRKNLMWIFYFFYNALFYYVYTLIVEYRLKGWSKELFSIQRWRIILLYLIAPPVFFYDYTENRISLSPITFERSFEIGSATAAYCTRVLIVYICFLMLVYGAAWLAKRLMQKKLNANIFGIIILLSWLPLNISMGLSFFRGIYTSNTEIRKLNLCVQRNISSFNYNFYTSLKISMDYKDFYDSPEVILFNEAGIRSLDQIYLIRHSLEKHLKNFELQDYLQKKYFQQSIADDKRFSKALLGVYQQCDIWPKIPKREQEGQIDDFKKGFLNTMQTMQQVMHNHNISSEVEFKIAYLKESLKSLDLLQDLWFENSDESRKKIEDKFYTSIENINEIVRKESKFISNSGKNFAWHKLKFGTEISYLSVNKMLPLIKEAS